MKVECDICGKLKHSHLCDRWCRKCGQLVCDWCWLHQSGKGHAEAEHLNTTTLVERLNIEYKKEKTK